MLIFEQLASANFVQIWYECDMDNFKRHLRNDRKVQKCVEKLCFTLCSTA